MKFIGGQFIMFLGMSGIGPLPGAQIRFFDVYYILPPVVGVQILGGP